MSWLTPSFDQTRNVSDKVLREGQVQVVGVSDRLVPCILSLTQEHFVFAVNGSHELILPWRYVYGCHCLRGRQGKSTNAYFCIYAYPPTKKKKMGAVCHRQVLTFSVNHHNAFSDNMNLAKAWQTIILECIKNSVPYSLRIPNPHLPYIVFLNRKAGAGNAFTIFEKCVNPVFGETDVPYKLVLTERANHAREMCRSLDPRQYRGIVVVSGDGLMFEVLNGLFERDDRREVVPSIPIGVVAGGSGNGLAAALCHASGLSMLENIHTHNALMLAKPMLQKMDVVRVQTKTQSLISFLSVTWAMIADIDIQSERLRALGGVRFTVAAIAKILGARTYRGTISFLPAGNYDPAARLPAQRRRITSVGPMPVRNQQRHSVSVAGDSQHTPDVFNPSSSAPSRMHRSLTLPASGKSDLMSASNGMEDLDDIDRQPRSALCFSDSSGHPDDNVAIVTAPEEEMANSLLVPLDENVPENWVSITDDFLVFCATYQTHIATDAFIVPDGSIDDGLIHLFLVRTGASRSTVLNILTSLENGQHVNSPYLEMIKCRAFRLTPHTPDGIISVDGERMDYGPIQAELHSQKVTVITNRIDVPLARDSVCSTINDDVVETVRTPSNGDVVETVRTPSNGEVRENVCPTSNGDTGEVFHLDDEATE